MLGMPGSGKSEAIKYLQEKHTWPKVYFGDVLFEEMKKRGLDINEKNERIVREDLRAQFGINYFADKVVEKIDSLGDVETVLVESLYSWEEYLVLKNRYGDAFKTIAVYASPKVRYMRLAYRPTRPLTEEEAQSRDRAQIENLHQGGPIAMADAVVINEGSMEEMQEKLDAIL